MDLAIADRVPAMIADVEYEEVETLEEVEPEWEIGLDRESVSVTQDHGGAVRISVTPDGNGRTVRRSYFPFVDRSCKFFEGVDIHRFDSSRRLSATRWTRTRSRPPHRRGHRAAYRVCSPR